MNARRAALSLCALVLVLQTSVRGEETVLENGQARLAVGMEPLRIRLLDTEGGLRASDLRPLEFRISGEWRSAGKVERLEKKEGRWRGRVDLDGGSSLDLTIEPYGSSGFSMRLENPERPPSAFRAALRLDPVEEIYGFGEMWNGRVAQRGSAVDVWAKNGTPDECAYMPYYVSTRNYALFVNYGGRVRYDVGKTDASELRFSAETEAMELVLVTGDSIPATVAAFFSRAGLPSSPPRWAFEPWVWLMADPDLPGAPLETLKGSHVLEMVRRFKSMDIPLGVTWLEPTWQTQRTDFRPRGEFSPDLRGLLAELSRQGVRTLAWTVPYTTGTSENWKEAVEKGYLVRKPSSATDGGEVKISSSGELDGVYYNYLDFYNPEAAEWWRREIDKALSLGFSGFKLDAGQDLPEDAVLRDGRRGKDVHNSYAVEYARVYADALRARLGDDHMILSRASWIGAAAHHNFKWPGDLAARFSRNGLASSVYSTLSLAFCGTPFLATDIGGFQYRPPPEDVWIRWAQFGALLPGMQTLHMPWWYSSKAAEHYRYLSWLHRDLIPFWRSLARDAELRAAPLVRPLVWDYQDDVDAWRVDDAFTVGNALLVAPIVDTEMSREVYLPAGRWHDFWDWRVVHQGPKKITWSSGQGLWRFPLFVREGAIIPLEVANEVSGFGDASSAGALTLAVWFCEGARERFVLRDREGPVPIELQGKRASENTLGIGASSLRYLVRMQMPAAAPSPAVSSSGAPLPRHADWSSFQEARSGYFYDEEKCLLWVHHQGAGRAANYTVNLKPNSI